MWWIFMVNEIKQTQFFTTEVNSNPQFKSRLWSKIQRCEKLNGRVQILTHNRTKWQFLESYGNGYEMSQMYQTIRVVLMVTICILSKRIWLEPKVRLTIWSFRLNERSVNHKRSFRDKMVDFRDIVWPHKAEHLTIRFLQIENRKTSSEFSLTTKIPFSYFKFATSSEIQMKQKSRQNWGKTMNAKQVKNSAFKHFMKCQRSYHILRRYRCWWRMLETKCVI